MKVDGYVILDYEYIYGFAVTKEHAMRYVEGTFGRRTDFKIFKAVLEYEPVNSQIKDSNEDEGIGMRKINQAARKAGGRRR